MRVGIMQPYFLPYLGYWQLLSLVDTFVIYDNIQYTKKGWINRNRFLQNGQAAVFTVPLKSDAEGLDVVQRSVADDFDRAKLLNRLKGAYQKAPFFAEVFALAETVVGCRERNLFEYLRHSVERVAEHLRIDTPIVVSSTLEIDHSLRGEEKVIALCKALGASGYVNPLGGLGLYSKEAFSAQGIELKFLKMREHSYPQLGAPFVSSLSILDVMMFNSRERIAQLLDELDLS
jgi:hypothetical protein